jgi:hypothetical protein
MSKPIDSGVAAHYCVSIALEHGTDIAHHGWLIFDK